MTIVEAHFGNLHAESAEFARRAAERLLPEPVQSAIEGFGDYAINGLRLRPEQIALLRPAAVLIAVSRTTGGVLFTQRAKHLSKHPGQISLPGGRIDRTDAGPLEAAMREAEEEVGLPASAMQPIGYLDEYFTGTGFRITTVIAMIDPFELRIDPNEVESVFETPIGFLMEPSNHDVQYKEFEGIQRRVYALRHEDHYIWGVTAGIIRRLYERVFA